MFYINPLREEVLHFKPRIVVYHNVLSDEEVERIKQLAIPKVRDVSLINYFNWITENISGKSMRKIY